MIIEEKKSDSTQYTYDTPNNIIKKEGDFFRNITSPNTRRPLWLRVFIVIFITLLLIVPGVTFIILSIVTLKYYETPIVSRISSFAMGIFFTTLGLKIAYTQFKKIPQ